MTGVYLERKAVVGVVGLGYVGMPLALAALNAGFRVLGFDIDRPKIDSINSGRSYLGHISDETITKFVQDGRFSATGDFHRVSEVDAILVCVPTPLSPHREPDLTYVRATMEAIAPSIRRGHLVVLESTTWPGTTDEVVKPILEQSGLKSGRDFFLAYSPEREDPGNTKFATRTIPKVVGADDVEARRLVTDLYSSIVECTVPVSSAKTAEAVKLTENIFRAVNIALVNELKLVYEAMGIDVWEVIDAASTKPFGYMPFYPGPGLGGHCIPIDPFYLTWKAREYEISTRFIELAGEINTAMPQYVVDKLAKTLDLLTGKGLRGSVVLIVGMSYKKNVGDIRESPSLKLMTLLESRGARTAFYDPYIETIPVTREHPGLGGRKRVLWDATVLRLYDAAIISTDHDSVDYHGLCDNVAIVIDTRNICERRGIRAAHVIKA